MKFEILLISGTQVIKTGHIFWCQGDGQWSFEADDEKVSGKLREICQEGKVVIWKAIPIQSEGIIADGIEMIGPSHEEFPLALEHELAAVGVLELRAVGKD